MTLEESCTQAILEYAPYYRQINAALHGEHREYVDLVLRLYRDHYWQIVEQGGTTWYEPDAAVATYLTQIKPY